MTCKKGLAAGQWWNFCGETDMGQTLPVQCTDCGGDLILRDDPDAEEKVKANLKKWEDGAEDRAALKKKNREEVSQYTWDSLSSSCFALSDDPLMTKDVIFYAGSGPNIPLDDLGKGVGNIVIKRRPKTDVTRYHTYVFTKTLTYKKDGIDVEEGDIVMDEDCNHPLVVMHFLSKTLNPYVMERIDFEKVTKRVSYKLVIQE